MMKKASKLISLLVVLVLAVSFAGCSKPEVKKVTIEFDSQRGSAVATIELEPGAELTPPSDPTRSGFDFKGWYIDAALTRLYEFPKTMPDESIKLYARWVSKTVAPVLAFNSRGGSEVKPITNVKAGDPIPVPADPQKAGHIFAGWYKTASYTEHDSVWNKTPAQLPQYDFSAMPEDNSIAFASWYEEEAFLTLDSSKWQTATTITKSTYPLTFTTTAQKGAWDAFYHNSVNANLKSIGDIMIVIDVTAYMGNNVSSTVYESGVSSRVQVNGGTQLQKDIHFKEGRGTYLVRVEASRLVAGGSKNFELRIFPDFNHTDAARGYALPYQGGSSVTIHNVTLHRAVNDVDGLSHLIVNQNAPSAAITWGANAPAIIAAKAGEEISKPENFVRDGYTQYGWSLNPWSFDDLVANSENGEGEDKTTGFVAYEKNLAAAKANLADLKTKSAAEVKAVYEALDDVNAEVATWQKAAAAAKTASDKVTAANKLIANAKADIVKNQLILAKEVATADATIKTEVEAAATAKKANAEAQIAKADAIILALKGTKGADDKYTGGKLQADTAAVEAAEAAVKTAEEALAAASGDSAKEAAQIFLKNREKDLAAAKLEKAKTEAEIAAAEAAKTAAKKLVREATMVLAPATLTGDDAITADEKTAAEKVITDQTKVVTDQTKIVTDETKIVTDETKKATDALTALGVTAAEAAEMADVIKNAEKYIAQVEAYLLENPDVTDYTRLTIDIYVIDNYYRGYHSIAAVAEKLVDVFMETADQETDNVEAYYEALELIDSYLYDFSAMPEGINTVYAVWKPNTAPVTVTYNLNGGSIKDEYGWVSSDNVVISNLPKGAVIAKEGLAPVANPTKIDSIFTGWYAKDKDGKFVKTAFDGKVPAEAIEVFARWIDVDESDTINLLEPVWGAGNNNYIVNLLANDALEITKTPAAGQWEAIALKQQKEVDLKTYRFVEFKLEEVTAENAFDAFTNLTVKDARGNFMLKIGGQELWFKLVENETTYRMAIPNALAGAGTEIEVAISVAGGAVVTSDVTLKIVELKLLNTVVNGVDAE